MAASGMADRSKKRIRDNLGELSVEEFMALSSSADEEEDEFLRERNSRKRKIMSSKKKGKELQRLDVDSEEEVGVVEPRPFEVTSWKKASREVEEEGLSGSDDSSLEKEEERVGKSDVQAEDGNMKSGKLVTLAMIEKWVKNLDKNWSLHSLRSLCAALHGTMTTVLHQETGNNNTPSFTTKDSTVFNALVIACLQHVPPSLHHYFPETSDSSSGKMCLPSSQKSWKKVRRTLKQYLLDLLLLTETLQDKDMQRAILKQVHAMAPYFLCFPKVLKSLNKCLITKWSTADSHVQVLAFLAMRRVVLFQPHPALHNLLKKAYMAFVRNCKFNSASTVSGISFMSSSLVELLALDPPTAYQHGFVYIRQLAIHLRTALISGKKDAQQAVYNWQFVHCLNLWTLVVCGVSHSSLQPLVYPLVQIMLGTLQVQPSANYHPLRLHLVKMLLRISSNTGTYIPMASYLLEVIEVHGAAVSSGQLQSGKPPDLSFLLRASKQQLNIRAFRALIINEAYQLFLQYFCEHAHYIGFPELAYPSLIRLRKVMRNTPYSWLRTQLKQMVEKVEEVIVDISKDRASFTGSPGNLDLVTTWEKQRKEKQTSLSRFFATWTKFNAAQNQCRHEVAGKGSSEVVAEDAVGESCSAEEQSEDEDLVCNLELDSNDGD